MKQIFFLLVFFFSVTLLNGQKGKITMGIGPQISFPTSGKNFSYYYKNGYGGLIEVDFGVTKLGYVTSTVSYQNMQPKNLPVTGELNLSIVKAGYKTRFLNSGFFTAADAGIAKYGGGKSNFLLGFTIGHSFRLSDKSGLDIFSSCNQVLGTGINNLWVNIGAGWNINLKK